jgi:hypothetical protein
MGANSKQVGGTHYKDKAVQPWDAMEAWLSPIEFQGFLRGNAIKYLSRNHPNDLDKAVHYLEKLREVLHKGQDGVRLEPVPVFPMSQAEILREMNSKCAEVRRTSEFDKDAC